MQRHIYLILRWSQLEDLQIYKDPTDLNEVIEDVIKQLHPLSKEKGVVIQKKFEPLFLMELDSMFIGEVLFNVIENAIKYSRKNGNVWVKTKEKEGYIEIKIIDQGIGINSEDKKRVFEKFYRSPKHRSYASGIGLGLYLSKYFIQLHDGKITMHSQEGRGTQIQIYLPIQ